jgi:hypothetical protein
MAAYDLVCHNITAHLQPAATALDVLPQFIMWTLVIIAQVEVIDPGRVIHIFGRRRSCICPVTAIGKLAFLARTAVGAGN